MFDDHLTSYSKSGNRVYGNLRAAVAVLLIFSNALPGYGRMAAQDGAQGGSQSGAGQSAAPSTAPSTSTSPQAAPRAGQTLGQPSNQASPQTSTQSEGQRLGQTSDQSTTGKQTSGGQDQEAKPEQSKDQQQQKVVVKTVAAPEPEAAKNPNAPDMTLQTSPYTNIPSLTDLYSQIPTESGPLYRFGSDVFRLGSGNAEELPDDIPVGPDYILGTGDTLTLNVWGSVSDRLSRVIDRQGQVDLPEAGPLMVSGMTIAQAQAAIQRSLNTQYQGEHVEISLEKVHTVRIYVVGEVQRPGAYDVSSLSTPLGALFAAGGPTSRGSLRILRQLRGQQLVRQIDLYDFLLKGVHSEDERLMPGDTLMVPTEGPLVTVGGAVRRPAIYELNGEKDLNSILNLAGGVLITASLKQIEVQRIEANEKRAMFHLKLPDNLSEVEPKLAAFEVKDGDSVFITQIMGYNEQAVYLDGHVYRPGKYAYHEGMTITDVVHSYQDILPEPGDYAELVRLQPPDLHPEVIPFSLHDAMIGNVSMPLRPFDLIRISGRYSGSGPNVTITGEVNRPGTYPMFEGMKVGDLLRMAGGFKSSAYREDADLTSYIVEDNKRVAVNHTTVPARRILEGDKTADRPLKSSDVLNIRALSGWQDIGATITISGEVDHPGVYGIVPGERLSSVLKRAGGFREQAYPYAAVFERVQARQLAEQARDKLIQRIEQTPVDLSTGTLSGEAATAAQSQLMQQRQQILASLRSATSSGRMVINITSDVSTWENTPADVELRDGDTLAIPKRPSFVSISGQVYNPLAIGFNPGKDVGWYLNKAGGPTPTANKGDIYVLRADGSVVPRNRGMMKADVQVRRGDVIFVPEKIAGPSLVWQSILGVAQLLSVAAMPIAIALH